MEWWLALAALATLAIPLGVLYRPLGDYMAWVYTSERDWGPEKAIYRVIGVDPKVQQSWRAYFRAILAFSAVGLIMLYAMARLQQFLPYALGLGPMSPHLAFNTAASFVGNTNWQSYVPETTIGYAAQMLGLTVQSFASGAVGMAVAVALVRGIASRRGGVVGNFWVDLIRSCVRILLPMSILAAVILIAGGIIQNFAGFTDITTVAGGAQSLPGGPVASQESIKMLGTNGGGFFNANSAHPFESATPWTNLFESFLLVVIPFALPRTLGTMVKDQRMGYVVVAGMAAIFLMVFVSITASELSAHGTALQLAGGAMEGKEQRLGIAGSTIFATATTGTTGGAANSMHSSYTAIGGMVMMLNMALGEVSPGGVGTGLYTMLVLVIISVFLTGLLLGRAPVFLGKRIGVREMVLCGLVVIVLPALALGGLGISLAIPAVHADIVDHALGNPGSHGLSELIYAFISASINNGSSFAGLSADTPYLNTVLGGLILLGRFIPIALIMALAGSFAEQDRASTSAAELPVYKPQFVLWLVFLVIFIALPSFLPMMMAGPMAEALR